MGALVGILGALAVLITGTWWVLHRREGGREVARDRLGSEGWLHLEVEADDEGWYTLAVELDVEVELSDPSADGVPLHRFVLSVFRGGELLHERRGALSDCWERLREERTPHRLAGPNALRTERRGRVPLLDLHLPERAAVEVHLRLPWKDAGTLREARAEGRLRWASLLVLAARRPSASLSEVDRVIVGSGF